MMVNKRTIAFAPMHNTKGRKDATGAFIPEAKRFLRHHGIDPSCNLFLIDNKQSKKKMREDVITILNNLNAAFTPHCGTAVAFFCHGTKQGIQFSFNVRNVAGLAKALVSFGGASVIVPLYACSTGRDRDRDKLDDLQDVGGDGGFADVLRDTLCDAGGTQCVVDAHTSVGHTTRNPNVRRFLGSAVGGIDGFYIVSRHKRKLWRTWRKALRTDYRFVFPFLAIEEIHHDLARLM